MLLMQPAVAVFDLDGTLIDSAADLHRAVNRMLTELGCAPLPLAEVRTMIGDGVSVLDPATALPLFLRHYEADPAELTRLYPGVHATLERLRARGVTLAICTNKPARVTRVILGRLGIEQHFSRVIGGDSLPFRKPDPRALLELLNDLGAAPAASLMVGDSEVDAATAQAAGVPFVLMTHGYHRGPLHDIACVAALDHFDELAGLVTA